MSNPMTGAFGGFKGPAPMQEQTYPTGVKPGSETFSLPMPQAPPDAMAEFQKLGPPPRRQQVERGQQSKYAPFAQALSGLGDVFAAKAGQRGNYLDKNIALTEGMRDQDYRDRMMQAGTQYEGDQSAYNQRVQGMNLAHQLGREAVADKARQFSESLQTGQASEGKRRFGLELDLKKAEADRAETERKFWRDQASGMSSGGTNADIARSFDLQLAGGANATEAQKLILADTSIPLKERLRRVDLLNTAAQRKASEDNNLMGGAYMFGQDKFSVGGWQDLVNRFRQAQDDNTRAFLLEKMRRINPAGPLNDPNSQLPEDVRKWATR